MIFKILLKNYKKIILIFCGLLLLSYISQSLFSILFITFIVFFTYVISHLKCSIKSENKIKIIEKISVPLAFLILVLFNIIGLVNTLTGSIDNKDNTALIFVGITFYLLSAAAYISDIKYKYTRGNFLTEFIDLYLYIVLPFKLLAGPLESPEIIKQFDKISFDFKLNIKFLYSFTWVSLGAFMKFCIASRLTPVELLNFTDPIGSFICALIFELKFYFDFAGYSLMAYGLAKLVNLKLILNFNHPFTARSVVEFWHKWHISLGKFLQKYILIKNLNLFESRMAKAIFASTIFVISAMWHGGTINYLFWGLFHGSIYLVYIQILKFIKIPRILGFLSMFLFFVFGRMIAIDIYSGRLYEKFLNYFNIDFYLNISFENINNLISLGTSTYLILYVIIIFFFIEFLQVKIYNKKFYHFFRKPIVSIFLFLMIIIFGFNSMELLYARL
jgi:alginate O-acetyltransferase complex protein AlgI